MFDCWADLVVHLRLQKAPDLRPPFEWEQDVVLRIVTFKSQWCKQLRPLSKTLERRKFLSSMLLKPHFRYSCKCFKTWATSCRLDEMTCSCLSHLTACHINAPSCLGFFYFWVVNLWAWLLACHDGSVKMRRTTVTIVIIRQQLLNGRLHR